MGEGTACLTFRPKAFGVGARTAAAEEEPPCIRHGLAPRVLLASRALKNVCCVYFGAAGRWIRPRERSPQPKQVQISLFFETSTRYPAFGKVIVWIDQQFLASFLLDGVQEKALASEKNMTWAPAVRNGIDGRGPLGLWNLWFRES